MNSLYNDDKNPIKIRKMTMDDLIDVYAIEKVGQVVPWSEGTFKDCLEAGYNGWVLTRGDVLQGYILAYVRAGECHILNFCVKTSERGQGYGYRLLQNVLQFAQERNAETAILEVRPSNHPAIHLYRKAGFNEVTTRKDYYATPEGGREDALVLVLEFKT